MGRRRELTVRSPMLPCTSFPSLVLPIWPDAKRKPLDSMTWAAQGFSLRLNGEKGRTKDREGRWCCGCAVSFAGHAEAVKTCSARTTIQTTQTTQAQPVNEGPIRSRICFRLPYKLMIIIHQVRPRLSLHRSSPGKPWPGDISTLWSRDIRHSCRMQTTMPR